MDFPHDDGLFFGVLNYSDVKCLEMAENAGASFHLALPFLFAFTTF